MDVFRRSWSSTRLAAAVDDSRWGQAFARSLAVRALVRTIQLTARSLAGESSFTARLVAADRAPSDYRLVTRLVVDSRLYRLVSGAAEAAGSIAWPASMVSRGYSRVVSDLDRSTRVRLLAWAVIVAALARAVLDVHTLQTSRWAFVAWLVLVVIAGLAFALANAHRNSDQPPPL